MTAVEERDAERRSSDHLRVDVDVHTDVAAAQIREGDGELEGMIQDTVVDRFGEASQLGEWQDLAGTEDPAKWMDPPHERLDGGDLAVARTDGLVERLDLACVQGVAQMIDLAPTMIDRIDRDTSHFGIGKSLGRHEVIARGHQQCIENLGLGFVGDRRADLEIHLLAVDDDRTSHVAAAPGLEAFRPWRRSGPEPRARTRHLRTGP